MDENHCNGGRGEAGARKEPKGKIGKALLGICKALHESETELLNASKTESANPNGPGAFLVRLFLLVFQIPFVSSALSAVAPAIKALVDKLPARTFHHKLWEHYREQPNRLSGARALLHVASGFFWFVSGVVASLVMCGLLMFQGCVAALSGDDAAMQSTESDVKWFSVCIVACTVCYFLDLIWSSYWSVGVIRMRPFAKENKADVQSVALAVFAFALNVLFLSLVVAGLVHVRENPW